MAEYVWQDSMSEISARGGDCEQECRAMLWAGLGWLDAHPEADIEFAGFRPTGGYVEADSADALALRAAIDGASGEASQDFRQVVLLSCLYVRDNGWEGYVAAMQKPNWA